MGCGYAQMPLVPPGGQGMGGGYAQMPLVPPGGQGYAQMLSGVSVRNTTVTATNANGDVFRQEELRMDSSPDLDPAVLDRLFGQMRDKPSGSSPPELIAPGSSSSSARNRKCVCVYNNPTTVCVCQLTTSVYVCFCRSLYHPSYPV